MIAPQHLHQRPADQLNDESAFWKQHAEEMKAMRQKRNDQAADDVSHIEKELGLRFDYLSPWHIRIESVLDVWPSNKKYHDLQKNEYGRYRRLLPFLRSFFHESRNTETSRQITCPHCNHSFKA